VKTYSICAVVAAVVATAIPTAAAAKQSRRPANPHQGTAQTVGQGDVLWWLPADTESVVAARGPFRIPMPLDEDGKEEDPNRKVSRAHIRLAFDRLPLELFEEMGLSTLLHGSVVTFAMQGSRHFRKPLPSFEVMDYEGCSIVVFQNNLGERANKIAQLFAKKATSTDVAGTKVLVSHEKSGPAEWSYFLALPRPNVVLAANNLAYLQEVLERMAQRKMSRAVPEELPEWRFLDPAVRFWALRHYDPTRAKEDSTSPFSEDRSFGPKDDQAIGLLVTLDPRNPQTAIFRQFSGDEAKIQEAASKGTAVSEPEEGVKYTVTLRSPQPGLLEQVYTIDQTGALDYLILNVQMALGRGMYF